MLLPAQGRAAEQDTVLLGSVLQRLEPARTAEVGEGGAVALGALAGGVEGEMQDAPRAFQRRERAGVHFAEHAVFGLDLLDRNAAGEVEVSATTDEVAPESAVYDDDVAEHWKYTGLRAVQTWIAADPSPGLQALVNARRAYWASTAAIPGGAAYENVELKEPFRQGREFRFRVDPE